MTDTTYRSQVLAWTSPVAAELLEEYAAVCDRAGEDFWKWALDRIEYIDGRARNHPEVVRGVIDDLWPIGRELPRPPRALAFSQAYEQLWRETFARTGHDQVTDMDIPACEGCNKPHKTKISTVERGKFWTLDWKNGPWFGPEGTAVEDQEPGGGPTFININRQTTWGFLCPTCEARHRREAKRRAEERSKLQTTLL